MQTAKVINPLDLEVVWVDTYIEPPHEVRDNAKRKMLTDAMDREGWVGAPIVASRFRNAWGQDRAYTGSHRLEAWQWRSETGAPIPCVFIEDIAAALGIDWGALMDDNDGDDWEAATTLAYQVPVEVHDAYGLDIGGA